jgi:hypothetical protein
MRSNVLGRQLSIAAAVAFEASEIKKRGLKFMFKLEHIY